MIFSGCDIAPFFGEVLRFLLLTMRTVRYIHIADIFVCMAISQKWLDMFQQEEEQYRWLKSGSEMGLFR
jgi:hypothetical protein